MPKKSILQALQQENPEFNSYMSSQLESQTKSLPFQLISPVCEATKIESNKSPSKLMSLKNATKLDSNNEKNQCKSNLNLKEIKKIDNLISKLKVEKKLSAFNLVNPAAYAPESGTQFEFTKADKMTQEGAHYPVNPDLSSVKKIQKEIRLRDFENLERMTHMELDSIGLKYLQKLYMIQPSNTSSLLYRLQQQQNSNFDGSEYTTTMFSVMADCYQLPNHPHFRRYNTEDKERQTSEQPYDELFIWSLLLYSGNDEDLKLPRLFWSKAKFPVACCLAAIIIYQNLMTGNLVPDYLKEEMEIVIKEFEVMASEVLKNSNEKNQLVAQDLLICELEIFFKHTILELAIKAHAYDFVCLAPVQQLLTDVWYDKINSYVSSWQIFLPYVFFPLLLSSSSYFRSDVNEITNQTELNENEKSHVDLKKNSVSPATEKDIVSISEDNLNIPNQELSYRCTKNRLRGLQRIYSFYNAPIIKFINHFLAFSLFLMMFSFFLLFDYHPDRQVPSTAVKTPIPGTENEFMYMTITELFLVISVVIYHLGEVEQFIKVKTFDQKFFTKLKCFYTDDKWNLFDVPLFCTFYAGLCVRLLPMYGKVDYFGNEDCYEVARVLYCIDLILWYVRILQKVSCLTFWGPKIIIIQAMVNKLVYYVVLILIFLVPFSTAVESILHKTQAFSLWIMFNSINRTFWSMFGELLGIITEFHDIQCSTKGNQTDKDCQHKFSTLFLYGSFAFYTVTVNLLLLNMIIATFASTVEEIERDSTKFYRFQRFEGIKEFAEKSMIPAPFVIIEYGIKTLNYFKSIINGEAIEENNSFRIERLEDVQKNHYIQFETESRDQYYFEKYAADGETVVDKNDLFIKSVNRLEESLNLFKIWSQEQINEKFRCLNKSIDQIISKLDRKSSA